MTQLDTLWCVIEILKKHGVTHLCYSHDFFFFLMKIMFPSHSSFLASPLSFNFMPVVSLCYFFSYASHRMS